MGYQIYEIDGRDCGYGVPAWCDHPDCTEEIDRGLAYVCGSEPAGGEHGCGLYFCEAHRFMAEVVGANPRIEREYVELCERCYLEELPHPDDWNPQLFTPKPDHPEWIAWKLTDESWAEWRAQNPERVAAMTNA